MPTLRFGKVWRQEFAISGIVFCNLNTPKTVISNFVTTRQLFPHILPHLNITTPTMFPVAKKTQGEKKVSHKIRLSKLKTGSCSFGRNKNGRKIVRIYFRQKFARAHR
jgi:hypothetical protein